MAHGVGDRDSFDAVRAIIHAEMVEHSLPSVAVAVARGGETLWEAAFGWADREQRVPATPHTLYSLASISKPITTTGLMVLVERGQIDLDRPINDYLGDAKLTAYVGDASDATVRRVANHTAGLPLHYQFFYEDEPHRRPSMDETILRYGNLISAPDERFQYSNLGYGILDYIIARVSGKAYADFMREEVFLPLGMTRASIDIAPGLEPYAAARYASDGTRYPFYDFDHPGGSAVFCSAHALLRFGMFHVKTRLPDQKLILSDATIDEMQRPVAQRSENVQYGIGWGTRPDLGPYKLVGHDGGMGGVRTALLLVPSEQLVAVVLTNSSHVSPVVPYGLCQELFAGVLPGLDGEMQRLREERAKLLQDPEPPPPFEPPAELIGAWRGSAHTYVGDRPFSLQFKESGDVHAKLGDEPTALVNDVTFKDSWLTGQLLGDIDTPDASRRRHHLHLDLRLRDGVLSGALMAISVRSDSGQPGKRVGNALNHPLELRRP